MAVICLPLHDGCARKLSEWGLGPQRPAICTRRAPRSPKDSACSFGSKLYYPRYTRSLQLIQGLVEPEAVVLEHTHVCRLPQSSSVKARDC